MRPFRVLLTVTAAVFLAAACSDDSPPAASGGSSAPASSPSSRAVGPVAPSAAPSGPVADLTAAQIIARAKAAFAAVPSVHVIGGGTSGQSTFKVDMRYGTGDRAVGTVDNAGDTVELRRLGPTVYIKASAAFWSAAGGAKAGTLFGGKYVKAPATDQRLASIISLTDKAGFIDSALSATGTVTKGATGTIRGVPAIALSIKDSSGGSTLYVATTGQPVPLEAVPDAGGTDTGKVDFGEYGAPVDVQVPPAAQTVDVSALPAN